MTAPADLDSFTVSDEAEAASRTFECAVLGAMLLAPGKRIPEVVSTGLRSEMFARRDHQVIYRAILRLSAAGKDVDGPHVLAECEGERLDSGFGYLTTLIDNVVSAHAASYAHNVIEAFRRRSLASELHRSLQLVADVGLQPALDHLAQVAAAHAESTRVGDAPILDDVAVMSLPEPGWLVDGLLPLGGIVPLIGPYGTGKTALMIDLGLAVATGKPWMGAPVPTEASGPVVYVCGEGGGGIAHRIAGAKVARGILLDDAVGLHVHLGAVNLMDPAAVARFIARTQALDPRVVILDTLHVNSAGADENSSGDMGTIYDSCRRIQAAYGMNRPTILLPHHPNKTGLTSRGSGAIEDDADAVLYLAETDGVVTMTCKKQKDGAPFTPIAFEVVPPAPGVPSISVRVLGSSRDALANRDTSTLTDPQIAALDILADSFGATGATAGEWKEACAKAVPAATFYRARTVLVDRFGLVRKVGQRYYAAGRMENSHAA